MGNPGTGRMKKDEKDGLYSTGVWRTCWILLKNQQKCWKGLEKPNTSTKREALKVLVFLDAIHCHRPPLPQSRLQTQTHSHVSKEQTCVQHSKYPHTICYNADMPAMNSWQQRKEHNAAVHAANSAISSSTIFCRGKQLSHARLSLQPSYSHQSLISDHTTVCNIHPSSKQFCVTPSSLNSCLSRTWRLDY